MLKQFILQSQSYLTEMRSHSTGQSRESVLRTLGRFPQWRRSLGGTPIQDGVPWVTYRAIDFLRATVTRDMCVCEYGVGGSTVFFSGLAGELVSIEHDAAWAANVRQAVGIQGNNKWQFFLVPPVEIFDTSCDVGHITDYSSSVPDYKGMSFKDYARAIDRFPDESFDVVLVDGRCRVACALHAMPKVKRGGFLIVDDADRARYAWLHESLVDPEWTHMDLSGPAPYVWQFRQTSAWQRAPRLTGIDRQAANRSSRQQ